MAKSIATIADVNSFDTLNPGKFTLTIAASIIVTPNSPTSLTYKKEIQVALDGSENPQQMNTTIANSIIAYATSVGVTLTTSDISVPKFS